MGDAVRVYQNREKNTHTRKKGDGEVILHLLPYTVAIISTC
jgi:hypothetical protein